MSDIGEVITGSCIGALLLRQHAHTSNDCLCRYLSDSFQDLLSAMTSCCNSCSFGLSTTYVNATMTLPKLQQDRKSNDKAQVQDVHLRFATILLPSRPYHDGIHICHAVS